MAIVSRFMGSFYSSGLRIEDDRDKNIKKSHKFHLNNRAKGQSYLLFVDKYLIRLFQITSRPGRSQGLLYKHLHN